MKSECKNKHCGHYNYYGDKYCGYCLECHNAGVEEIEAERDAALKRVAELEAARDKLQAVEVEGEIFTEREKQPKSWGET